MTESGDDGLQRFWALANRYARVGDLDVVVGTPWGEAVAPPAWSFGDSPELADAAVALVLCGAKTATTALRQDYSDEPLPKSGDLSIILDGAGRPRALIRTVQVVVARFADITEPQAGAEGEGDQGLDVWRARHRRLWNQVGVDVTDDTEIVWERFKRLYPV